MLSGSLHSYVAVSRYVSLSLLVAGFFVQLSHLAIAPMHWLSFVSYPRFAITGLSRLELHGVNYYPPSMSLSAKQLQKTGQGMLITVGQCKCTRGKFLAGCRDARRLFLARGCDAASLAWSGRSSCCVSACSDATLLHCNS